jgi:hypothetical protein
VGVHATNTIPWSALETGQGRGMMMCYTKRSENRVSFLARQPSSETYYGFSTVDNKNTQCLENKWNMRGIFLEC